MYIKFYIIIALAFITSHAFAQTEQARSSSIIEIHTIDEKGIVYPGDGLIEEEEGLVICRIFLDKDKQYKKHMPLYSSHDILEKAVAHKLSQMAFEVANAPEDGFYFLAPFVFKLISDEGEIRTPEAIMQDGNACMQYGMSQLAMGYYNQILMRKRRKGEDFFEVNKARMDAAISARSWSEARREVTNMLAMAREENSPHNQDEAQLRIQRTILSLLAGQATSTISDLKWLDRHGDHNISLMSDFIENLHLPKALALDLSDQAAQLQQNMPSSIAFWLEGVMAVSLSQGQEPAQAYLHFDHLLQNETQPAIKAGLLCQMGLCLYNQGRYVEALASLQEATQLSPEMPQGHFYKALSLAKLEYDSEAHESMRSALALGLPYKQQVQGELMLSILAVSNK